MRTGRGQRPSAGWLPLLLTLLWLLPAPLPAAAQGWALGGRFGSSVDHPHASLVEFYGRAPMPPLAFLARLDLHLSLELSAGRLQSGGAGGTVAHIGPVIAWQFPGAPLYLDAGVRPGYLERYRFPRRHLGGPLTFASHVGLQLTPFPPYSIGYRLLHFSNAYLYDRNPGLNLHTLQLQLHF